MLIKDIKNKGITSISLEATEMGRPLYKKYRGIYYEFKI